MPPTSDEGHKTPDVVRNKTVTDQNDVQRVDGPAPPRIVGPTHDAGAQRPIAKEDFYTNDAGGVRRIVRAGSPVPLGYEYSEDQVLPRGEQLDPASPSAADPYRATYEEQPAGTRPAVDVEEAAALATGQQPGQAEDPVEGTPYSEQTPQELEGEIERRRAAGETVEVTGTGKSGKVNKDDLIAALENADKVREQPDPPAEPEQPEG